MRRQARVRSASLPERGTTYNASSKGRRVVAAHRMCLAGGIPRLGTRPTRHSHTRVVTRNDHGGWGEGLRPLPSSQTRTPHSVCKNGRVLGRLAISELRRNSEMPDSESRWTGEQRPPSRGDNTPGQTPFSVGTPRQSPDRPRVTWGHTHTGKLPRGRPVS